MNDEMLVYAVVASVEGENDATKQQTCGGTTTWVIIRVATAGLISAVPRPGPRFRSIDRQNGECLRHVHAPRRPQVNVCDDGSEMDESGVVDWNMTSKTPSQSNAPRCLDCT